MASTVGGQATDNTEIINANAIGIQRAIKSKIRYKSEPSGHVINLSKHSFSLDTFKLLNKNLDFVPTPKKYNKKLKIYFALSNFELTSKISTQSRTQIKKTYPFK